MLRTENFWQDEGDSPLLARNFKFITLANVDELIERVSAWKDLLSNYEDVEIEEDQADRCTSEEFLRIFLRDAERTYVPKDEEEEQKRTLERHMSHVKLLKTVVAEVKDYHQGMGYIAAFLGLFLPVQEASRYMLALHRNPKYCKGYFSATPQRFVADARVLFQILLKKRPELHKHLSSKGVLPEMFTTKWFVGLCLHVLPFSALFDFYEAFFTHGVEYLFKFGIAYMQTFETDLMAAKDTSAMMAILRAEDPKCDWKPTADMVERQEKYDLFGTLVQEAHKVDLDVDLETLRENEAKEVAEAVARAKKRDDELKELYSDDEIVFSDEED